MADVQCPQCKGLYHKTVAGYNPDLPPNGKMFHLRDEYGPKGANWHSFPETKTTTGGELTCPNCMASYLVNGKVNMKGPKVYEDEFVCHVCGKKAKNKAGLASHLRTHNK